MTGNYDGDGWLTHYELTGEPELRMSATDWRPRRAIRDIRAYDQSHAPDMRWNPDAPFAALGTGVPICWRLEGREIHPRPMS